MPESLHFDEFNKVSREDWLERIRRDLKDRSLRDAAWQADPDLMVDPFVHAVDPDVTLSGIGRIGQWQCGDVLIVNGDEDACNGQIIEVLRGGVEALHLEIRQSPDWKRLLRDVQPGMIHLTVDLRTPEPDREVPAVLAWYEGLGLDHTQHSLTLRGITTTVPPHPHTIEIAPGPGIVDHLSTALRVAIEHGESCEFKTWVGPAYFLEIARLRALRILVNNARQALKAEWPFTIETHFAPDALLPDPDQNMIRMGSLTLSAILGGADRIYTRAVDAGTVPNDFQRRMARNVHHLFRYESHIDKMHDPVAGAYYFEKLTRQIVEQVWARLLGEEKMAAGSA
ncbi:MAG: methylmalonyl-CoA mutase family protein [Saprospiraceae bacterium]|nr:methylmalonyl-CoA mutase family protein [Saprospiraceae bacterium]